LRWLEGKREQISARAREENEIMPVPAAALITKWLENTKATFPSQYGEVTNWQWIDLEWVRIPWAEKVEDCGRLALADMRRMP
jgi:hypothetical protein